MLSIMRIKSDPRERSLVYREKDTGSYPVVKLSIPGKCPLTIYTNQPDKECVHRGNWVTHSIGSQRKGHRKLSCGKIIHSREMSFNHLH